MTRRRKIIIIILVILIVGLGSLATYKIMHPQKDKIKVNKDLDSIKGFDYKLEDRDKEIYKKEFKILKKNLESNKINYEEYAKSIAKMFIIDLYTINNKINKYDIGSLEFIHPDALENYKLNVKDTIYKYVDDNSYDNRTQNLPEVTKIKIDNFEELTYKIKEEEVPTYMISLSWEYIEDLEYDNEAVIVIVKKDNKLYVVEKKEKENKTTVDK